MIAHIDRRANVTARHDAAMNDAGAGASSAGAENQQELSACTHEYFLSWDTKYHTMKCAGVGDTVSVADFKAECLKHLENTERDTITLKVSSAPPGPVRDFGLTEMLNISSDELETVKEDCDPQKLLPAQELDSLLKIKECNLPSICPLKSIQRPKLVKKFLCLGSGQTLNQSSTTGTARDNSPEWRMGTPRRQQPSTRNKEMESEIILTVLVFHPVRKRPDQEFYVLSSQPLTVLRDKIVCPCDYFISHDFSDDLDAFETHYSSLPGPPNLSLSAFFFINDVFYSDHRHPQSNENRVSEIIKWSEALNRKDLTLDHFSKMKMETTKFEQLTVRLGFPYLYNHHGNCEHLVVFADLRLYNPAYDSPDKSDYPILVFKHKVKYRLCSVCDHQVARWVTEDDDLAPESPCFFCQDCFKKLHYSKDNKKLCNFKAYPFNATV